MPPWADLEQRLRDTITQEVSERGKVARAFYQVVRPPEPALVCEAEKDGQAEVTFTIPAGCICVQWRFLTGYFRFLQEESNADGPLLLFHEDGRLEAHVVECKRKVTQEKWNEILKQMRWTLRKLMALTGALGLKLDGVTLYTAYRYDDLSEEESLNASAAKRAISASDEPSEDLELNSARRKQIAWQDDRVRLDGFEGIFKHRKIPLDPTTGTAASAFTSPPAHP